MIKNLLIGLILGICIRRFVEGVIAKRKYNKWLKENKNKE